jgi:hypothetical protein
MMSLRKIIILVLLVLSTTCLALGFAWVAQWMAIAAVLTSLLAWLAGWRWPTIWSPSAALIVSISLAAAGLLAGASPLLMLLSVTPTIAVWDLVLLDQSLTNSSPEKTLALLEHKHYESLALALGLGLLAVIAGHTIRFQIPFAGIILLAILAFFGLDRIWRSLGV